MTESSTFRYPHLTLNDALQLPSDLQQKVLNWWRLGGNHDQAEALLVQIEERDGLTAALLDEAAALALARNDGEAVRAAWERRFERSAPPSARAQFATALLELGQLEEAAEIAEELAASAGDLATVRALVAEISLQQGDPGPAYDLATARLRADEANVSARLSLARIALLSGDVEAARASLSTALDNLESFTGGQLATAAGLAEFLGQPARAQALRLRGAMRDAERVAALATAIDEALGRPAAAPDSRPAREVASPRSVEAGAGRESESNPTPELLRLSGDDEVDEEADAATLQTLRDVFGYDQLRPGQARIINQVLRGQDTLAILPTGAGKSLTFQLPAAMLPQTTLVLSPLIALMKDQVDGLPPSLREQTVLLNSTLSPGEQREVLDDIASGHKKLVYAAPERLRQPAFLRALRSAGVSLVVVDEAHCISLWGHNFRPDYLTIPGALPELGDPPLLAMTATATPETARALSESFRRHLEEIRTSSFRENLFYAAEKHQTKEDKARRIVELCRETMGQGIVYVSSKRDAENLAGVLRDNGVKAVHYHAGMRPEERATNQDRYMRGEARVIVATVAFGMGVNKPDVRFIIHFSPATSLEAYAQESGRAGRDGLDSRCVLLYTGSDGGSMTRLANRDAFSLDMLREVFMGIRREAVGAWAIMNPSRITLTTPPEKDPDDMPDPRIGIGLLEMGGLLARHPTAPVKLSLTRSGEVDPTFSFAMPESAALWEQFVGWIGLDRDGLNQVRIDVEEACNALQISPETLIAVLDEHPEWDLQEGERLPCFQLLSVGDNAAARLQRVLDDAARRGQQRVKRMMAYAEGRRCRHVMLAAHLGESLEPCGDACDICTGEVQGSKANPTPRKQQPRKRTTPGAADAVTVLKALASAPFPVGKTGLTRLLEGSIQSRIRADRSAFFGALSDLQKSKIDATIDALVNDGALAYDHSRDYPVLRLSQEGIAYLQNSGDGSSTGLEELLSRAGLGQRSSTPMTDDALAEELSSEDAALLERLRGWRLDRAREDSVPAYVVAPNTSLVELALRRPQTATELAQITGLGPARVEKYGEEILAVLASAETITSVD